MKRDRVLDAFGRIVNVSIPMQEDIQILVKGSFWERVLEFIKWIRGRK